MKQTIYALVTLLAVATAMAADDKNSDQPKITPPPPPEALTKGQNIEPKVTIVKRNWATIEEYSVNGRVYAVKISPSVGPPYFMYDSDGNGSLDTRRDIMDDGPPAVNRWKILTW